MDAVVNRADAALEAVLRRLLRLASAQRLASSALVGIVAALVAGSIGAVVEVVRLLTGH
ncbi:MAG: hypothetical protein ACYDCI_06650 [Candidatus Limnocylindrales bacterium]